MQDTATPATAPTTTVEPTPVAATAQPVSPVQATEVAAPPIASDVVPVVTAEPKQPEIKPTLLTEEPPVKVDGADTTQPVGEQKEEGAQSEEPAQLPSYDDWTLPEDMTLDKERIGAFNGTLAEFQNMTKADKAAVQEFGQKMVDMHIAELKTAIEAHTKSAYDYWENQKNTWKESFEKDPEIGGNRKDTTLEAAKQFIRSHGGNDEQRNDLLKMFNETGVGNHPALIRLLANANTVVREGTPLAAAKPAISQSKVIKRYGDT